MKKSKWRQEQEAPMDSYPVRMTGAHARRARQLGEGNMSAGVRLALEVTGAPEERRRGPADRRKSGLKK